MTERTNAVWFFVALFGGGIAIWWTKSAFTNAWIAAVVAACVVFALMIYYILNDEDAPEEEGDNVYYLGLLFTLISLLFTLVALFGSDIDVVRNAKAIHTLLENFGIALSSTVVGIAGRVAVQNWQRTGSSEALESAEEAVLPPPNASAQNLEEFNRHLLGRIARDLTQGANALARFHRIVRSHATDSEDYLHNHSKMLRRESAELKDTLQRNADTFALELKSSADSTIQTVGRSLDTVAKQTKTLLEQFQSAHDGYLAEVRETTRSLHTEIQSSSSQSLDVLLQNFDAVAKQNLSLMQNLSTVNERVGKAFDNLESNLTRTSVASAALGNSANQTAKSTGLLEVEVEKLRSGFTPFHVHAKTLSGVLDSMGKLDTCIRAGRDTEQTAAAVQQIGESLRTITAEAATTTKQAEKAAELIDALTQSIQTTEGETRRAVEALRVLANEAEARTESLRQRPSSGFRFWNRNR